MLTNERMSSIYHHSSGHVSRVDIPCLLYGTIGVCLALAMHVVGLLKIGDKMMLEFLTVAVFKGQFPKELSMPVQVVLTAVFCYGLAFVILDTVGTWRRVLIGGTVLVLAMSMVPTLAVWNIYFSPFLVVVGVFWTWFCTMMYVNHHLMPCEVAHAAQVPPSVLSVSSAYKQPSATEVARVDLEEKKQMTVIAASPAAPVPVVEEPKPKDELAKYQPKELDQVKGKVKVKEKVNG